MTASRDTTAIRLRITGAVQGVGFRPFVYREAKRLGLDGWVRNTPSGVDIIASGPAAELEAFLARLREDAPPPARVDAVASAPATGATVEPGFRILESDLGGARDADVLPDLATCPECLAELRDPANRRFRYPFINCTACGPRYSIMHALPYDRARTTMQGFHLCPECAAEFTDPSNRRFHAQPNACPACGPSLALWDRQGRPLAAGHDAIEEAAQCLRGGGIVAVKGLGGFHLMVDATSDTSVRLLRDRKHREEKPFAVMVPDLARARQLADITTDEARWMTSPAAPIVLVRKRGDTGLSALIARDNPWIGLFLAYTPLHHLLMDAAGRPLVATSGNLTDEPICTDEYEALERLGTIADFFLVHNRPIAHPVDDSVMRVALGRPLMIRCGRGFAPLALDLPDITDGDDIALGVGAHMKSTFGIARGCRVTVSPHIGDLETIPAWQSYEHNLETLGRLFETEPARAACDRHPDYASTRFARRHFRDVTAVQHHHAHILAVMAEHRLGGPVLGFALDGTGFGDDGTIWGGEVLLTHADGYERVACLRPFALPGGDAAAREPRRSAFGVLRALAEAGIPLPADDGLPFTAMERAILSKAIAKGINTVQTSSAGRLFDAAASLLGLCHAASYEGQAAMMLQACAETAGHDDSAYPVALIEPADGTPLQLDWGPIVLGLLADRESGVDPSLIAARFHRSLVALLVAAASRFADLPVVLGGGCFQNGWLLEHTVRALRANGRIAYWPERLPPNDGAICVGQLMALRGGRTS